MARRLEPSRGAPTPIPTPTPITRPAAATTAGRRGVLEIPIRRIPITAAITGPAICGDPRRPITRRPEGVTTAGRRGILHRAAPITRRRATITRRVCGGTPRRIIIRAETTMAPPPEDSRGETTGIPTRRPPTTAEGTMAITRGHLAARRTVTTRLRITTAPGEAAGGRSTGGRAAIRITARAPTMGAGRRGTLDPRRPTPTATAAAIKPITRGIGAVRAITAAEITAGITTLETRPIKTP